jgi:hypothetical protein
LLSSERCPDASKPIAQPNGQALTCGAGFDGAPLCPQGYYCHIELPGAPSFGPQPPSSSGGYGGGAALQPPPPSSYYPQPPAIKPQAPASQSVHRPAGEYDIIREGSLPTGQGSAPSSRPQPPSTSSNYNSQGSAPSIRPQPPAASTGYGGGSAPAIRPQAPAPSQPQLPLRICCALEYSGAQLPPVVPVRPPYLGKRPANPGEVYDRGSLPNNTRTPAA